MAKTRNTRAAKMDQQPELMSFFDINAIVPQKFHYVLAIGILLVLFMAFLNPLFFGGKSFHSSDIVASSSMETYLAKDRPGFTLWNPHVFCGMPAYSISVGYPWFNLVYVAYSSVVKVFAAPFAVDYAKWVFYLILFSVMSFSLMKHLVKNTLISLFTAVATGFSTGFIVFLFIGHVTKLTALCMYPLIFLLLLRMQKKIKLLDAVLLTIAIQIMMQGFHVQIIYYFFVFVVGIYFIFYLLNSLFTKNKELLKNLGKSFAILVAAGAIAILIQADSLSQVYEYTPYSTRGTKGVKELTAGATSEKAQSDFYAYHTDWSFSPGEIMTFIIPSYYGFGYSTYKGPLLPTEQEIPTYFGQMPFVDVPMYMGVVVFFLALFAMITRYKEPLVRYLTILVIIALTVSFGKNLPILFDLLFSYLPYFEKFRVPSMILVLVQFAMPILAGLGLEKIVKLRDEEDLLTLNILRGAAALFGVVFVVSILFNQPLTTWFSERVLESARGEELKPFTEYMSAMFTGDMFFGFLLTAIAFIAGWLASRRRIAADAFIAIVIVVSLVDLWRIDARGARYVDAPAKGDALFTEPDYVRVLKGLNDKEPYRILNLKQDNSYGSVGQNSNFNAYFLLEDFDGYSAIKPRAYQDIKDIVGYVNPTLWRMANVKYLILDRPFPYPGYEEVYKSDKTYIYRNTVALRRWYFADRAEQKQAMDVLQSIKENRFNPSEMVYTEVEAPKIDTAGPGASIKMVSYADESSVLDVNATGNNFVVFATTYHPKGWHALVDGQEVPLYRANHAFMGAVVPKGKHTLEFRYAPKSFYVAKYAALGLSSLVMLGLFVGLFLNYRKRS